MGKPTRFKKVRGPWKTVTVRTFQNASELHEAYNDYAQTLNPEVIECKATLTFEDGSSDEVYLIRETKELIYKDYEGEEYFSNYYGKAWKFQDNNHDFNKSRLKLVKDSYAPFTNIETAVIIFEDLSS